MNKNTTQLLFELKEYTLFEQTDISIDGVGKKFIEDLNKKPFHIYCVVKRPKILFNPKRLKITNESILIPFDIYTKSGIKSRDFSMQNLSKTVDVNVEFSEHNEFIQISSSSYEYPKIKASCFLDDFNKEYPDNNLDLDYELLYVGKSHSKNGEGNATDRIFGHEMIQKIYSDLRKSDPMASVWFMLCDFHYYSSLNFAPSLKRKPGNFVHNQMKKSLSIKGDEKQKLVEASLINYFKPEYNDKFKDNFPSEKHKSYSTVYGSKINAMSVEFGTQDIGRSIYTENTKRSNLHIYRYEF